MLCCFNFCKPKSAPKSTLDNELNDLLKSIQNVWPKNQIEVGLLEMEDPNLFYLRHSYSGLEDFKPEYSFGEQTNDNISKLINTITNIEVFGRSLNSGPDIQIHLVGKDHLFSCLTIDEKHLLAVWVDKDEDGNQDRHSHTHSHSLSDDDSDLEHSNFNLNYTKNLGQKYADLREISEKLASVLSIEER
eukprot:TRINITY_DN8410_c1_g1_i1.p1 TRINITY_DN8410_c1_g1~~TRINITY_DN8410_c1_g1_i1.p1  ORF type:complete len:189 (+),score=36.16 TRINITY_DN8410_c1_g1_i1:49-615(+)